ncbi:MAG: hypothetical protein OEY56_00175 [Cyclobacteriaceae bacterium]|nr:hypothetical protein [Cyclobacteriaceae bacterium]
MTLDFEKIQDKQRIVIIGNEGTLEITRLAAHVLSFIKKPFDYAFISGEQQLSDAPVILIQGDDHIPEGSQQANFHACRHHIAVIHHIEEIYPNEYLSFDDYIAQYEALGDKTPKGGTIIYNQEDNLATVISAQKDREDVILIEYESLTATPTANGFTINNGPDITTPNTNFPSHAGAALTLLRRLGVTEAQFYEAIKTFKD